MPAPLRARIRLASPPAKVFDLLATDDGRRAFWADGADERDGVIRFRFSNGMAHEGRILESDPPRLFAVEYFGGSRAEFVLADDGAGGTDLTLTESDVPDEWRHEHRAGWVTVLLALKAAADFGVDLRSHAAGCTWEEGYVDV